MIQSSFPKVADQILNYNKNIVDILTKINSIATTTDPTVSLQIFNENGVLKTYNVPSVNSLKSEIDRLNNNINSMYSIDTTGSLIQTSPNNFKRVITVDLNREPNPIQNLGSVNTFKSTPNWFFDSMLNPMLNVEFDLSGQIEDNVRKVQVMKELTQGERLDFLFLKYERGEAKYIEKALIFRLRPPLNIICKSTDKNKNYRILKYYSECLDKIVAKIKRRQQKEAILEEFKKM